MVKKQRTTKTKQNQHQLLPPAFLHGALCAQVRPHLCGGRKAGSCQHYSIRINSIIIIITTYLSLSSSLSPRKVLNIKDQWVHFDGPRSIDTTWNWKVLVLCFICQLPPWWQRSCQTPTPPRRTARRPLQVERRRFQSERDLHPG